MKFAFELGQRVIVPHSRGLVQGQVVSMTCGIEFDTIYGVRALTDEGKVGTVDYHEGTLLAAQPQQKAATAKR